MMTNCQRQRVNYVAVQEVACPAVPRTADLNAETLLRYVRLMTRAVRLPSVRLSVCLSVCRL